MKKILIIEDELELGQNIRDLLDYLGYQVEEILDNGKDALNFLKRN
ncbi:hypothetical protein [Cecembia rubra]|nr:hypothetical protein [Cecembia rubra]